MPSTVRNDLRSNLVSETARKALRDAGGDVVSASRLMEASVRRDLALREAITDPLISSACYDAVRQECIKERRQVWRPPVERWRPGRVSGSGRVVHLAKGTLLMFPLPGGKPLGNANRSDLATAESFYSSQAADMGHKARWLQLIAQSVPLGKVVSDVLSDDRLRELQELARAAA